MREAANLSVLLGGSHKIKIGEGMRFPRLRGNTVGGQQRVSHQMRGTVTGGVQADIDVGFSIIKRQQLSVCIGHMEQMNITHSRYVVRGLGTRRHSGQGQTRRHPQRKHLIKFTTIHRSPSHTASEQALTRLID